MAGIENCGHAGPFRRPSEARECACLAHLNKAGPARLGDPRLLCRVTQELVERQTFPSPGLMSKLAGRLALHWCLISYVAWEVRK